MTDRDRAKEYLRTLDRAAMIDLCEEILVEGWEPRQIKLGVDIVIKRGADRTRLIKTIRSLGKLTMIDAQKAADNLPYTITRESMLSSNNEVSFVRGLLLKNGITFEIVENWVDDPYDYAPTMYCGPVA